MHVYDWDPDLTRRRLRHDDERWAARLRAAAAAGDAALGAGVPRSALVEFVPADDPGVVASEAAVLRGWLAGLSG